jgi:hypothetical protein
MAKEIGIISGPSDYFLPVPTARYHGLWLEIKVKPNRPTKAQRRWLIDMAKLGYRAEWCDTLQSAIDVLDNYCREVTEHLAKQLD